MYLWGVDGGHVYHGGVDGGHVYHGGVDGGHLLRYVYSSLFYE